MSVLNWIHFFLFVCLFHRWEVHHGVARGWRWWNVLSDTTVTPTQGGFLRRPIPRPVTAHLRPSSGELVFAGDFKYENEFHIRKILLPFFVYQIWIGFSRWRDFWKKKTKKNKSKKFQDQLSHRFNFFDKLKRRETLSNLKGSCRYFTHSHTHMHTHTCTHTHTVGWEGKGVTLRAMLSLATTKTIDRKMHKDRRT